MSQSRIEDLSKDPEAGKDDKPKASRSSSSRSSSRKKSSTTDNELRNRIVDCFGRITAYLDVRDDEELAAIIDEDAEVMANGLVALTKLFTPARLVIIFVVSVVEPVLAFRRVASVIIGRVAERRAARALEREAQAEEAARQAAQEPAYAG